MQTEQRGGDRGLPPPPPLRNRIDKTGLNLPALVMCHSHQLRSSGVLYQEKDRTLEERAKKPVTNILRLYYGYII